MDIQVYRINASPYQNPKFFQNEKQVLESIEHVKYVSNLTGLCGEKPIILISNTHTKPDEIPEQILKNTLLLIHPNSGYDNFNIDFIKKDYFPIIIGNEIRANAVAEYILSAIFQETCQIPNHIHWSVDRTWDRGLLSSKKVLIYGFGHIGKLVAKSLDPLVKELRVYDKYSSEKRSQSNWDDSLLTDVDFLITAASLNKENFHFFDSEKMKSFKKDITVINTARGPLFKEEDLVQFLNHNCSSRAYLDVFEIEPFKPGHLHELSNVIKTSHIAGVSKVLNQRIIDFEYQTIKKFMQHYQNNQIENFKQSFPNALLSNRIVSENFII